MDMYSRAIMAVGVVLIFPLALLATIWLFEKCLERVGESSPFGTGLRAYLWLIPGFLLVGAVLIFPLIDTVRRSFLSAGGQEFVGFDNFVWAFSDPRVRGVMLNTLAWVFIVPVFSVFIGLIVAVLADRTRYESAVKLIVVLPYAVSFAAAAVFWRQVLAYAPPGANQTGIVNALITGLGGEPVAWLVNPQTVNGILMFIVIWGNLGIATLILSAAVKGIPSEVLDAARMDGASEVQVFFYIIIRYLFPQIAVTFTLLAIGTLKMFDIVYVFTQGRFGTDVIGHRIYREFFALNEVGHGSALAVILFLAVLPVMIINIRRIRNSEGAAG